SLPAGTGVRINGPTAAETAGSIDVNGDGIDDFIIGAPRSAAKGAFSGESFVVFGEAGGLPATLNLSALDASNGLTILGSAAPLSATQGGERSGWSVTGLGDVNGDGIDDFAIVDVDARPDGVWHAGSAFVLYGTTAGFPPVIDLAALTPSQGF